MQMRQNSPVPEESGRALHFLVVEDPAALLR